MAHAVIFLLLVGEALGFAGTIACAAPALVLAAVTLGNSMALVRWGPGSAAWWLPNMVALALAVGAVGVVYTVSGVSECIRGISVAYLVVASLLMPIHLVILHALAARRAEKDAPLLAMSSASRK